jgi:RNA polymerase sigma factor (sigma-70 family)
MAMRLVPPQSGSARAPLALVVNPPHGDVDDAELARGLADGADWAIALAWHRFAPLVLTLAGRALGSKSDAEDLTQEVFARLLRRASTLRDAESLRSFVYSIAIRTLKSELRYRRLRAWLSFREPEALVDLRHSTPDLEARALLSGFYLLLDRLSPRDRLVFVLRRIESMTVEEIAATMRLSPSTVKRSLTHGSQRLSGWIERDARMRELLDGRFGERKE